MSRLSWLLGTLVTLSFCWGCVEQESDRPTEEDVRIIKQNILTKAPQMKFKVNADLEGKVTYLGVDVDKDTIHVGEPFKLTHYWKVNQPLEGWELFVHLNDTKNKEFINLDHKAIGGRYPVSRWKAGEIIRDEHSVTLPKNWSDTHAVIHTGLWKGPLRMKIKGPQDKENRILAADLPVVTKVANDIKRLVAIKATKPIKIDGKLDEETWSKAASTNAFVDTLTGGSTPMKTEAKVAWDDKFLYIAFQNEDEDVWSTFKKHDDKLWTQEAVEVFIDANGDGKDYIELQVNPNNVSFDSYLPAYRENQNDWDAKMKTAVAVNGTLNKRDDKDKGWTVELAIPWADVKGKGKYELTTPPKAGDTWSVNFFRMDMPKDKPQVASSWSPPLVGDFHKLDRFGKLVFGDEEGKTPTASPAPTAKKLEVAPPGGSPKHLLRNKILLDKPNALRALQVAPAAKRATAPPTK